MPLVASVDYSFPNPRIYLSADTVGTELDTIEVWREIAALRLTTQAHRGYDQIIEPGGNIPKTSTTFTPRYVQLLRGCRLVPFDTSHTLCLCRDTFTDDEFSGADVFDLAPLSPTTAVNIVVDVAEVEVRVIQVAGSNVITGDIADVPAAVQTGMSAQGYSAALATKMDQIQFTIPGYMDVNTIYMNDTEIIGIGRTGDGFRGIGEPA